MGVDKVTGRASEVADIAHIFSTLYINHNIMLYIIVCLCNVII
jgi:hypothetical protein